jgi:hypothetical protein
MDGQSFDNVARAAAALPRRRSLLLGGAALAAALAGGSGASAAKKAKKKCKKEEKQCRNFVQNFCADEGSEEQDCLDALLPCCKSCKVKAGVLCTLDVFTAA